MAQISTWLPRYLMQKLPTVYERQTRALYFDNGTYLPQTGDLDPGATDIIAELVQGKGEAAIVTGNNSDIPLVDVQISEDKYPTASLALGFRYEDAEARASTFAEKNGQIITNLKDTKMRMCKRGIDEKSHLLAAFGDARYNMFGMLNNPNVPVSTPSVSPHDNGATPDDIIQFFVQLYSSVRQATYLTESPDLCLVTEPLHSLIISTYRDPASSKNLKQLILEALGETGLKDIKPINELTSAQLVNYGVQTSGTNKDRIMFYRLDPELGFKRSFTSYISTEPERRKLGYDTYIIKNVSCVLNEYPTLALYSDYSMYVPN